MNETCRNTEKNETEMTVAASKAPEKKFAGWKRWLWVLIPAILTVILQLLARKTGWFGTWYIQTVYPVFVNTVGRIWSIFPFSVAEFGLYALILWLAIMTVMTVYRGFKKRDKVLRLLANWSHKVLTTAALLLMVYTMTCGINYYAVSFSRAEGFQIEKSSKEELRELCLYLVEQVNEAAKDLTTEEGCMVLTVDVQKEAVKAMKALGERYPSLSGYYPQPKPVLISRFLSVQQVSGIYSPFTVEANVNWEMTEYNIPVTACHELSHLKGFMREDEANFIAYLACMASDCAEFNYSGALLAFIYSGNALYGADKDSYWEIRGMLCDTAQKDLAANNAFWDRFETKIAEVHDKVNNSYLQMNNQTDGVKSYGRMVDLLLAMMRKEGE